MEQALLILEREASYRAEEATRAGLFVYQFEALSRNRLGYARGLDAMADDPFYDDDWRDYIGTLRSRLGDVDFADLIYVRSAYFVIERRRRDPDCQPKFPTLFGEKEGKIARANRGRDPLYLFSALQRQLGYPEVPRPKRPDEAEARIALLEQRVTLARKPPQGRRVRGQGRPRPRPVPGQARGHRRRAVGVGEMSGQRGRGRLTQSGAKSQRVKKSRGDLRIIEQVVDLERMSDREVGRYTWFPRGVAMNELGSEWVPLRSVIASRSPRSPGRPLPSSLCDFAPLRESSCLLGLVPGRGAAVRADRHRRRLPRRLSGRGRRRQRRRQARHRRPGRHDRRLVREPVLDQADHHRRRPDARTSSPAPRRTSTATARPRSPSPMTSR